MKTAKKIIRAYIDKEETKIGDFKVKLRQTGNQKVAEIWHKDQMLVWAEPNHKGDLESFYSVVNGDSADILNEVALLQGYGTPFNQVKVVGSGDTPPKFMVMYKAKLQYPTEKYRMKDLGVSYRDVMYEPQSHYIGGKAKWLS